MLTRKIEFRIKGERAAANMIDALISSGYIVKVEMDANSVITPRSMANLEDNSVRIISVYEEARIPANAITKEGKPRTAIGDNYTFDDDYVLDNVPDECSTQYCSEEEYNCIRTRGKGK